MTLAILIPFFILASLVVSSLMFFYGYRLRELPSIRYFLILMVVFAWVSCMSLLLLVAGDFESKVFFSKLRFAAYPLISPLCLLMSIELFKVPHFLKTWGIKMFALSIPILTCAITLFERGGIVFTDFREFSYAGFQVVQRSEGIIFRIYYLHSVTVILMSFAILGWVALRGGRIQKRQACAILIGGAIALAADTVAVTMQSPYRWIMLPTCFHLIYELGIAFAIFRYGLMGLVPDVYAERTRVQAISMISHDLAGSLKAISDLSGWMVLGKSDEKDLIVLNDSISNARDFLGNVLLWLQRQSFLKIADFTPFEARVLLRECIHYFELQLNLKQIEVVLKLPEKPVLIHGSSELISSVFRNLLSNAIRHSPDSAAIRITMTQDGRDALISFEDHGSGMPSEVKAAILRRDFSWKRSGAHSGYGLGLSLSQDFLDLHQGSLSIQSSISGTRMQVRIPSMDD